jgi:hypothetical protein
MLDLVETVFAGLAFIVSAIALWHSVRTSRKLTELAEPQARLAAAQHKDVLREQQRSLTADVRAELHNIRYSAYGLRIVNHGPAIARRVRMQVVGTELKDNFMPDQVQKTFPIAELSIGEPIELAVHRSLDQRYSHLTLILSWDDDSGVDRQREVKPRFH